MIARPIWPPRKRRLRGDIDGDCDIDLTDWGVLLSLYGTTGDLSLEHAFTWDAENRLTSIQPVSPASGSKRLEFKYDYRGRRVEKAVTLWNSGGSPAAWYDHPTETRRFVWNGWLMLREVIETDGNSDGDLLDGGDSTRMKTYTWGKDHANGGSRGGTGVSPVMLESAGGIGGLLAVYYDNATTTSGSPTADDLAYVYMYDANGNVGQVCNLSATGGPGIPPGALVATYEYDAYGSVTVSSGAYATSNTYRFSTKPWDDETGLGYWGYRYYDPRLGRWMSRDTLVYDYDDGSPYKYSVNYPLSRVDAYGELSLVPLPQDTPTPTPPPIIFVGPKQHCTPLPPGPKPWAPPVAKGDHRRHWRGNWKAWKKCWDHVYDTVYLPCVDDAETRYDFCIWLADNFYKDCSATAGVTYGLCTATCNKMSDDLLRWACLRVCDVAWGEATSMCRILQGGMIVGCKTRRFSDYRKCEQEVYDTATRECGEFTND